MRLTVLLLVLAAVGTIAGAALIAVWAVGVAVIADSVALASFALLRNVPDPPSVTKLPGSTLTEVLERARAVR